jgi:hypothetical protein
MKEKNQMQLLILDWKEKDEPFRLENATLTKEFLSYI